MITRRERLRKFIETNCLITGSNVTLSTGKQSSFYFDCKVATLHGEILNLIAKEILHEIDQLPVKPHAIGGLTMGADFITAAVILMAHQIGHQTQYGSIVRKETKGHGTENRVENRLKPGTNIVVVDDVITTGESTMTACEELERAGYNIAGIIAIIDREAGGVEELRSRYGIVRSLFRKSDFPSLLNLSPAFAGQAL